MLVLGFDTCFGACSAAVFEREEPDTRRTSADSGIAHPVESNAPRILASRHEPMSVGHAERLLPMIAEVMQACGAGFSDLGAIAVTSGPGTFTGVRTGIAAARALALATGLPVLGITSLALLARGIGTAFPPGTGQSRITVAACMPAGKGEIYAQMFGLRATVGADSSPPKFCVDSAAISEPMLTTAAHVATLLEGGNPLLIGVAAGDVASLIAADRARTSTERAEVPDVHRSIFPMIEPRQPSAGEMLERGPFAAPVGAAGGAVSGAAAGVGWLTPFLPVRPLYLRLPDATPQAEKALPRAAS